MRTTIFTLFIALIAFSFGFIKPHGIREHRSVASIEKNVPGNNIAVENQYVDGKSNQASDPGPRTGETVSADEYVSYARLFLGTPYLYASTDPAKGFDCSGFVNHVSHHFGLKVPRSSVDFTNYGTTIDRNNAQEGDLILFTGTDTSRRIVGHMGIVTNNDNGQIEFIHSSSGKANGVTMSELKGYYETRFVKVVRILS